MDPRLSAAWAAPAHRRHAIDEVDHGTAMLQPAAADTRGRVRIGGSAHPSGLEQPDSRGSERLVASAGGRCSSGLW